MLNLEIELIAILVLTAVLGLLMGRFLCKSGENDEREKKNKIIHAFKASQNELETSRDRVAEQSRTLQNKQYIIAGYEQEINNFTTKLLSSDTQRGELLDELKVLEKYKPKFESLDKEFTLQTKIVESLKNEKIANQKEIADFKILTNELNKNIKHLQEKESKLENSIVKLNETLKQQSDMYQKSEVEQQKKYKKSIASKEIEHERVLQTINKKYQSQLKSKDSSYEKLEQESIKKYKEMVKTKDNAYEELQQNTNKKYKEVIQLKDEEYEALEKNKTKAYEQMLESKTKVYNELKQELESLENEYEEFKINYNLDTDRLDTLESDHAKTYNTLETMVLERDDLLARLRAISSVVGAVGVDNNNNNLPLLEN